MLSRGQFSGLRRAVLCACLVWRVQASASEPSPTPTTPIERRDAHLSEYADRTRLDHSGLQRHDGTVVITNQTVERIGDRGRLTVGSITLTTEQGRVNGAREKSADNESKRRSYWRRRVQAQRDRIAKAEAALAKADARIEALEDAAFQGGRRSARLWAQVAEAQQRREIVERQLRRERAKLAAIIREARHDGAEPGWFR